jgi:hypothetical protein
VFFVRVTNKGLMLDAASTFDDTVFKAIVFSGGCTVTATRAGNRFGREVGVSVPCVWITLIVGFHKGNIVGAGQERFGQGNGEDCIVGKAAIRTEQIELLGLDVVPMSPAIAPIIWSFLESGRATSKTHWTAWVLSSAEDN